MKNTKSGSSASHKTPYIYFKQLLFLKNTVGNLNPESSITEKEKSTTDQEPLGPYSRENIVGRKKKKPSDDGTRELLKTLNKCIDTRKNNADILERDEDRMFLLSLLSSFRKIPEHKKPAAKIQLITMIDSFGTNTPSNVYPNSVWRNYNEFVSVAISHRRPDLLQLQHEVKQHGYALKHQHNRITILYQLQFLHRKNAQSRKFLLPLQVPRKILIIWTYFESLFYFLCFEFKISLYM